MKQTALKRLLSVFLVVLMLLPTVPVAFGTEIVDSGTDGGLTWTLDNNGVLTISGEGNMKEYGTSYQAGGYVSGAPWGAWYCSRIHAVVIEDRVTSICGYAFCGCYCLTSVTIGDSVTDIGNDAFNGCRSLTSVTIPDSVTSIGSYAFTDCISLTSVTIGDSVTNIGNNAFKDCSSLTSLTIPASVTTIGDYAFFKCTSMAGFSVDKNNQSYASDNYGCLYNKSKTTLIQYPIGNSRTSFTIPDSVTSIGNGAFQFCDSLKNVTIPGSVTSIGGWAFSDCSSLTSVAIPNSVMSIGNCAFSVCTSLTSVTIGNSVTSIGFQAFYYCTSLTSVTIGNSVTSIGVQAFSYCSSLPSVTIGNSVTNIGDDAFIGCTSLTSLTIPDSVTSIGSYAFRICRSLTSVTIPDSVTSIGNDAFYGCSGLTHVTISDNVRSIGNSVFEGCSSLSSATIGNGITSVRQLFNGCSNLSSVILRNSVTSIGNSLFSGCSSLTSVTIPNSVTTIGNSAFSGCSGLTSVAIPDSVTTIGSSAFSGCRSLSSVAIPDSVTTIGNSVFSGCSGLTRVTIPDSVTSIGNDAFYGCSGLTSVTIGDRLTRIGDCAFGDCSNLKDVFYTGTADQWNQISIGRYNEALTRATMHFKYDFAADGKVKLEFRYADTGALIDDIYYGTGVNFVYSNGVHWSDATENGILYLDASHFPLKRLKAEATVIKIGGGGGPGDEIAFQSSAPISARAGQTVVFYLSTNGTGSMTVQGKGQSYYGDITDDAGFINAHINSWNSVKNIIRDLSFSKYADISETKLIHAKIRDAIAFLTDVATLDLGGVADHVTANYYEMYLAEIILTFTERNLGFELDKKINQVFGEYGKVYGYFKKAFRSSEEWQKSVTPSMELDFKNFFKFDDYFDTAPDAFVKVFGKMIFSDKKAVRGFLADLFGYVSESADFINQLCDKITTVTDVVRAFREVYNAYVVAKAFNEVVDDFYNVLISTANELSKTDAKAGRKLRSAINNAQLKSNSQVEVVCSTILNGEYQIATIAYDTIAKNILTQFMCASAGKALHIEAGTVAFYLFLITSSVKITNALTGADDYSKKYQLISAITPVERAMHTAVINRYTTLVSNQTKDNALAYDTAYKLLQTTNTYLYQLDYDLCSISKKQILTFKNADENLQKEMGQASLYKSVWAAVSCHDTSAYSRNYKKVTVKCPVDVYVYMPGEFLVTSVVNEQIEEMDPNITVLVSEGEKTIIYPAEYDCTIKIVARENGAMDYSVSELNGEEIVREVETNDIPLAEGQTFTDVIPQDVDVDKSEYALMTNDETIPVDYDSNENCTGEHAFGAWAETETYRTRTCTVCGFSETESLHKTHDTAIEVYSVMPTCTTSGHSVMICPGCGEQLADGVDCPPLDHDYVDVVTPPTCTEQGYTAVVCPDCGDKTNVHDYVDALGHDADVDTVVEVEATCKDAGSLTYTCLRCNEAIVETIPATGVHTLGKPIIENQIVATCNATGSYDSVIYCDECGEELSRESVTVNALGHTDEANDGYCDRCGQMMVGDGYCPQCGKIHNEPLIGWLIGLFHRIIYRLTHLFQPAA